MTKRMLIDSTHAEETRVVVLDGSRLEDYDVETSTKQQLKGNIYLAKVVRVEPSLQAAFVEFGGGRHGFLAFGEIHPDYYQIPVADRKRLLEMQEAEAREEEEAEEREAARRERGEAPSRADHRRHHASGEDETADDQPDEPGFEEADASAPAQPAAMAQDIVFAAEGATTDEAEAVPAPELHAEASDAAATTPAVQTSHDPDPAPAPSSGADDAPESGWETPSEPEARDASADDAAAAGPAVSQLDIAPDTEAPGYDEPVATDITGDDAQPLAADEAPSAAEEDVIADAGLVEAVPDAEPPEHIGGELDTEDQPARRAPPRFMRNYKIQEVIRRRQIMLVQVVKEERGGKGAALTTYISLAGRFSVLMPNSPRGGGISRKITSAADRRRLKEITTELDLPRGMGLIVRTAGANRPKPEIIRDCEVLLNQWDQIRETTMKSVAPTLIYEEASLIKRCIRDVYSRDVDEVLVDGEAGWRAARDYMRMLMPAHAKKVQLWRDPQPLFSKAGVESQLDAMLQPSVQLRSGGYLVINQTEALVAIDVNSGRSTRERGIEETAFRTNLEAAEEAARQLRLRDLAGLIVIDFIDMESRRNNAAVERRLKDALRNDRARIQVGSISHFGLLEMSRQRLRPSLTETSFVPCPHCGGSGHMRSTESAALAVLRGIEEEGARRRAAEIIVHVHGTVALYILNHKRGRLAEIEARFGLHVTFNADETLIPPQMRIEKIRSLTALEAAAPVTQLPAPEADETFDADESVQEDEQVAETEAAAEAATEAHAEAETDEEDSEADRPGETAEEGEQRRKRRRRRRRGSRRDDAPLAADAPAAMEGTEPAFAADEAAAPGFVDPAPEAADELGADGERKRRGRRGGRRRRRDGLPAGEGEGVEAEDSPFGPGIPDEPVLPAFTPAAHVPAYVGPTPADPFGAGSNAFSFFDAVEEAEQARVMERVSATPPPATAPARAPVATPERMVSEPDEPIPGAGTEAAVPAAVVPAASEPEPVDEPAASPPAATPVPAAPVPAAPVPAAPVIVPILVGDPNAPAVEKKQGWWRR